MDKLKVGIIGATGYTGSELVRLLKDHPRVEICLITSESRAGERFSDVHPFFEGIEDQKLEKAVAVEQRELDVMFLALPHGVSMDYVKRFKDRKEVIIDLSGDFRLDGPTKYKEWYNKEHVFPQGFEKAVYGLCELNREAIKSSNLIANPGCYPTSAILGAAPLSTIDGLDDSLIVDAKSGITGAGVKAKTATHFPNVNDNFKAYGLKTHRHSIEIQDTLNGMNKEQLFVQFSPHLLPVDRGILSTIYTRYTGDLDVEGIRAVYRNYYADEPFVRLVKQPPALKEVRGTNNVKIYVDYDERTKNIIVISVIDNLVKGAAGQAIQNMNIRFGFDEKSGLNQNPLMP